jgi:hypothetical protein
LRDSSADEHAWDSLCHDIGYGFWYLEIVKQNEAKEMNMTISVQQLLDTFDALPDPDKHQAMVEILRRVGASTQGDLPDAALVEAADELFRALDAEESRHGQR